MERVCLECGAKIEGPWAVVIFPDFTKGFCTQKCWVVNSTKPKPPPASKWKGPVIRYKWSPQGQIG